jgi:hypothetical protein
MNNKFSRFITAIALVTITSIAIPAMLTQPSFAQTETGTPASPSDIPSFSDQLPEIQYKAPVQDPFSDSDASNFGGTDFRSFAPKSSVVKSLEFMSIDAFYKKYMAGVAERPLTIDANRPVAVLVMDFPNGLVNSQAKYSSATVVQAIDVLTKETLAVSVIGEVIEDYGVKPI